MGKLPLYCSSTCSRRWFDRTRRGEPGSDEAFAEWQLHQAQTRCAELGIPVVAASGPVQVSPDAMECVCGETLAAVPNPVHLVDSVGKWTQAGWCDRCRRGFVVVVTRRPMRRHEEEPVLRARHTLEVTR